MSKELQNKLYHYEVQPPAKAWEAIAAALDESLLNNEFPSTLYNLETAPPGSTWEKISSALDGEMAEQPVEKRQRKIIPFIRYAAAAAVVGILLFAGIKISRNTGSKDQTGTTPLTKTEAPVKENNGNPDKITTAPPVSITTPVMKIRDNTNAVAANNKNRNKNKDLFIGASNPVKELEPRTTKRERHETGITAAVALHETSASQMGRYITLMTSDGNIIRMSNKLSDMVCCVSGEDQDNDCKFQLKKWRAKIASSTAIASPGNFMDILNMVNCLQEN
ncbi:MAG TPA: hypothetical protein VLJ68_01740 [Chitinophagaceae bacterium]|nr:hypothetical protein [Chitinophagaceae bacterium]